MREPGRLNGTLQCPLYSHVQVSQVTLLVQPWNVADGTASTIFYFALISALRRPLVEEALFGFKINLLVFAAP